MKSSLRVSQIKLPSFTLQPVCVRRQQKPDPRAVCCRIWCRPSRDGRGCLPKQSSHTKRARPAPIHSAKRVCPHTLLSSLGNEISPLSRPYVSAAGWASNISGERTMTSLNIGTVCVFVGGCVRPLCVCAPTDQPGGPNGRTGQI